MNGYTNQYLANTVLSASPEQLMLMLYDGAGRFLAQAIQAIEGGQTDKRAYFINKASAIVSEFAATLDRTQAPVLAEDLTADDLLSPIIDAVPVPDVVVRGRHASSDSAGPGAPSDAVDDDSAYRPPAFSAPEELP